MTASSDPNLTRPRLGRLMLQMAGLVVVSAACGAIANSFGPKRIPWQQAWSEKVAGAAEEIGIRTATLEDAQRILDEGMHFIFDARSPTDFEAGHLPGAMLFYSEEMDTYFPEYAMMLTPEQGVMVYCSGKACDESLLVSKMLFEQGFTNVHLFAGGMEEWTAAGLPTERGL